MEKITYYRNKKVLILGFAKSGASAAEILLKLGALVTVSDTKDLSDDEVALNLMAKDVKFIQKQTADVIDNFDILVKNPGIPYTNPVVVAAVDKGIKVISEIEIAGQIFSGELVAVTGSNGKTTTTTLITKLLANERENGTAVYAGNIGIPASTRAANLDATDTLVVESSSFQLMGTETFHPHIAVLTNIFASHLDYHGTRENYVAAKMKITANQAPDDFFVVNYDYEELVGLAQKSRAKIVPFSRHGNSKAGAYVEDKKMYWQGEYIMDTKDMGVPGEHNVENALAAIAVAKIEGRSNAMIAQILKTFSGVRHRTQFVLEADERKFYNDSKATDIEATQMALAGFDSPVVLIAGGLDRGDTYERLEADLRKHVRAVVLCGENKAVFADSAKAAGIKDIVFVDDVSVAVAAAWKLSQPGDIILLSPAAASWDQYPNFEVRGELFIQAVEKLTNKEEI